MFDLATGATNPADPSTTLVTPGISESPVNILHQRTAPSPLMHGGRKAAQVAAADDRLILIKIADVVNLTGMSERWVRRRMETGVLPRVHLGRAVRIRLGDVRRLCAEGCA